MLGALKSSAYDTFLHVPVRVRAPSSYAPQFDALFPLLTVREHLQLYARIKGIPEASIAALSELSMQTLGLKVRTAASCLLARHCGVVAVHSYHLDKTRDHKRFSF